MWFFPINPIVGAYTWTGYKCPGLRKQQWVNGSYGKMESWYNWAADRYNLKILTAEEKNYAEVCLEAKIRRHGKKIKSREKKK